MEKSMYIANHQPWTWNTKQLIYAKVIYFIFSFFSYKFFFFGWWQGRWFAIGKSTPPLTPKPTPLILVFIVNASTQDACKMVLNIHGIQQDTLSVIKYINLYSATSLSVFFVVHCYYSCITYFSVQLACSV